jgi:hypothetical protein
MQVEMNCRIYYMIALLPALLDYLLTKATEELLMKPASRMSGLMF